LTSSVRTGAILAGVRICFVCLGNICRSPAAAAVFRQLAAADGVEVTVDSAGTSRYHLGEHPHEHTTAEARRLGITIDHRARQFTAADFDRFDLVVAMDAANHRDLLRLAPDDDARAKVVMLRSFAEGVDGRGDLDVPDPWGRPPAAYAEMYDLLDAACRGLVDHVRTPS
jgi:protein-tyrosine phosphatase